MNVKVALNGIGIITPVINDITDMALCCTDTKDSWCKMVENIPPPLDMNSRELRRMAHLTRLALYAADKAIYESKLNECNGGLYVGLTHGSTSLLKEFHDYLFDFGPEMVSPNAFSNGVTNAPLGSISKHLGLTQGGGTLVGYENCGMEILHYAAYAIAHNTFGFCCAGATEEYSPLVEDAYKQLNWYKGIKPYILPSPISDDNVGRGFPLSEGSVFFSVCSTEYALKTPAEHQCFFTPVANIQTFKEEVDLIISGAGGGPQDIYELEALSLVLSHQKKPVGILFSKCFFGETFAVSPLLSSAMAWDILINSTGYPPFATHNTIKQKITEIIHFTDVKSILVIAASRNKEISAGLFTKIIL